MKIMNSQSASGSSTRAWQKVVVGVDPEYDDAGETESQDLDAHSGLAFSSGIAISK